MTSALLATAFFTSTSSEIALFAGCASLLGIAILSLLVFSQAREIRRLRDWAGRAPERAAEMEQRVSEAAAARTQQPTAVAQSVKPVPRTEPIHSRAAVAAAVPAATKLAGEPAPGTPAAPPSVPGQAVTATGEPAAPLTPASPPAAAGVAAAPPAIAPTVGAAQPAAAGPKPIPWQEPTPTSAPNGSAAPADAAAPAPATPAGAATPKPPSAPAPRAPSPPSVPAAAGEQAKRPPIPPAPTAPRRDTAADARAALAGATAAAAAGGGLTAAERLARRERRPRGRMLMIAAGVLVIVVLGVVLLLRGNSSKTGHTPATAGAETTVSGTTTGKHKSSAKKSTKPSGKAVPAAETPVTVLNGTETEGLARRISTQLQQNGYSQAAAAFGRPPGANEATVVEYAAGHQAEAEGVAHSISVSHVQPIEQAVAAMSGTAKVVVIVGTDRATASP